jgi:RimJ/RimL family protein N-acetyltransferase
MSGVESLLPLLGLRVSSGPLELRGITDDLLAPLVDLALEGIHDDTEMPFIVPWSIADPAELPLNFAQYHWSRRSTFSSQEWNAELAVHWDGELVGVQGVFATDFLVTKTAGTGSWLARRFHGRGIGTAMRQAACAFAFDGLGAELMVSGAYEDNPSSLAVSRKVGYRDQGWTRVARLGRPAVMRRLALSPEDFRRPADEVVIEGLGEFRHSIGLAS